MTRSGRCDACKTSKIKCDEGVPQCQRCIKSGKTCPGYPSETQFGFRDMTCFAEKKVESRVHDVLKARQVAEHGTPTPCAAVTDWQADAVARFFADYAVDSDTVPNTTIVLPGLYSSPDADACFKDAVHAAAFVNQANALGLEWMAIEAKAAYGRALASLARVLLDPVEVLKDTTLATPFVIGLYEVRSVSGFGLHQARKRGKLIVPGQLISGYLPTGTLMDHHHHRGRMSLLRLRAEQKSISPTGRILFGILHEQAIIKCITRHEKPMEEASAWAQALGTKGPPLKVTQLSIQTAQICAEAQTLFDSSEHGKEWKSGLLEIIKDATALDNLYQNWIDKSSVSGTWRYHTLYLPPNDALAADGVVQVYHDLYTAYIWTSCCSKRAHLHEVSLRCLSLLGCHPGAKDLSSKLKSLGLAENLLARFRCIVEDMVSGICAAVPFMLGDVDLEGRLAREKQRMPLAGYLLLWPLHVARASSDTGGERELWIRGRLELIDSEMGIRFGRLMANKVKKEPWNLE